VMKLTLNEKFIIPGAARLGRRSTGVAHSKITRVRVLSWPLPVLPSLYFLIVTKSCHTKFPMKCDESLVFVVAEVVSNQFKAVKKIFRKHYNNGKNTLFGCFRRTPLYRTIVIMVKNTLFGCFR